MRRQIIMLVVTVVLIVGTFTVTILGNSRPVLGLDLQGGISIVLFPVKGSDLSTLDAAVSVISNRVGALGIAEPEVNRQGNTIVIDLPGVKDRAKAEDLVGQTAELRYREVQGTLPWNGAPSTPSTTTSKSKATTTTVKGATTTVKGATPTTHPATTTTAHAAGRTITTEPIAAVRPQQAATTPTTAHAVTTTTKPGTTTTTTPNPAATTCKSLITPRAQITASASVVLPDKDNTFCYLLGPTILTGKDVGHADARFDSNNGWNVVVDFKNDNFITKVAQPYVNKSVAIELDNVVQSAPKINPGITGRSVQITGKFSEGEAKNLALVLRYGSLPVQFDKDQQTIQSVSPSLGKDQLHAGIAAGLIGLALVALYMILLYRLLGLVVWIGLGLTGMLTFTLVTWLSDPRHAHMVGLGSAGLTLTLAGVTGLIVSVGVTVDSYVVYFERLKDEVRSGRTVRSSLDTGFRRAFRTIVAADLVSLIGAVVLWLLATGSVRGFAFFLGLSTAIDLMLAYTFMHPLVSVMARRPALVRMPLIGVAAGLDVPEVRA